MPATIAWRSASLKARTSKRRLGRRRKGANVSNICRSDSSKAQPASIARHAGGRSEGAQSFRSSRTQYGLTATRAAAQNQISRSSRRTSHRATRYCHQLHFLPSGGGPDHDEPAFAQAKIHRALEDAPLCPASAVPFQSSRTSAGYILEAFLPATVLSGFDPEQNPRLGFYYVVRDLELGEQVLSVGSEFPYWEDPSLWSVLELTR